jgi:enediyne biosynthesis protein E4
MKKEFPAFNRDDVMGQLPGLKKKFLTYKEFGSAAINDLFTKEMLKDALKLSVNNLASCFIKNKGKGQFEIVRLPSLAQVAPVFGMITDDYDADGNLDVIMTGNDFGNEVTNGRYDAFNGLVLKGDGQGGFTALPISRSGLYIPGNGKAIVKLKSTDNSYLIAASENRGPLRLFRMKQNISKWISVNNNDRYVTVTLKTGATRKEELYFGNSFLSQSSRAIAVNSAIKTIEATDNKMKKRIVYTSK